MLILAFIIFFILLLIGCPIHICMGVSATGWLLVSGDVPGFIIASKMYAQHDSFSLMAIPFFMLAGKGNGNHRHH